LTRSQRLVAWFQEAHNLRKFAAWNILFWVLNQPVVLAWPFVDRASWDEYGVLYVAQISVAALWLSSLAWWQSTRVEQRQIETEETQN
jgi:hypothetical protein